MPTKAQIAKDRARTAQLESQLQEIYMRLSSAQRRVLVAEEEMVHLQLAATRLEAEYAPLIGIDLDLRPVKESLEKRVLELKRRLGTNLA